MRVHVYSCGLWLPSRMYISGTGLRLVSGKGAVVLTS